MNYQSLNKYLIHTYYILGYIHWDYPSEQNLVLVNLLVEEHRQNHKHCHSTVKYCVEN